MANSSLPAEKDAGDSIGGRLVCRSDRRPAFPSVAPAGSPASASGEELWEAVLGEGKGQRLRTNYP